jgi:hypothetical protein
VSALVLAGSGLPDHEWSQAVRDHSAAEDAAVARGDLDAAADLNVRFWVDGPLHDPAQVDASVRDHVRMSAWPARFRTRPSPSSRARRTCRAWSGPSASIGS